MTTANITPLHLRHNGLVLGVETRETSGLAAASFTGQYKALFRGGYSGLLSVACKRYSSAGSGLFCYLSRKGNDYGIKNGNDIS